MAFSAACASSMRSRVTPFSASASTRRVPCLSTSARTSSRSRLPLAADEPKQAAAEPRAFLVRPVDQLQRHRRLPITVHAQRLERGHHAQRAVEPSAIGHRVEMAADDDRAIGGAGQRHPAVAGRVHLRLDPDRRQARAQPFARVAPHRTPREALRTVGGRGPLAEVPEVGDHVAGAHRGASYHSGRMPGRWCAAPERDRPRRAIGSPSGCSPCASTRCRRPAPAMPASARRACWCAAA